MKKRVLAVLLTAAMAVSALAGCGSKSADTKTDDTKAAETTTAASAGKNEMAVEGDDVTTLNVWTFIELHQQFYVDMAEKWNAENPDKKVKLVLSNMAYDDMHNKLSLALESGEGAPDIVDIELGKFPAFMTGKIGLMDRAVQRHCCRIQTRHLLQGWKDLRLPDPRRNHGSFL